MTLPAGLSDTSCPAFLRAVASHLLPCDQPPRWPDRPLGSADWQAFAGLVETQRVWSLLADAVVGGLFPATDEQAQEACGRDEAAVLTCLYLDRALVETQEILRDLDLRIFKGVASASLFYPEPALRTYSDVDILVPSAQFDRAAARLVASGAARHNPDPRAGYTGRLGKSAGFTRGDGYEIDLHRSPQSGPFGVSIVPSDLFGRPQSVLVGGQPVPTMSVPALFLAACYHAILPKDERRLMPLRDVAQILISGVLDEHEAMAMAARWQGSVVMATAVATAARFFSLPASTPLVRWSSGYEPDAREERWLRAYHDTSQRGSLVLAAYTASAFPSRFDGAKYLYAQVFHDARDPLAHRIRRLVNRLRQ